MTRLKGSMPSFSLVSFAHFFIDHLSASEVERLRNVALGLSGKSVPIGTTCSGLATGGPCVEAVFTACNERFGCDMKVSSEFAVEIKPSKQEFITAAHKGKLKHLFSDVSCFGGNQAYCLIEKKEVTIPKVFLLVSSPSCINLSGQRTDRSTFAACYENDQEDQPSESNHTYTFGYKAALERTEAEVSIYENVKDAAHSLKNSQGIPQRPAADVICEDLAAMGHTFEFVKLDSSDFLVPQRRERVWGSSSKHCNEDFDTNMKLTMLRLRSSLRFPLSSILDSDLSEESHPVGETATKHIKEMNCVACLWHKGVHVAYSMYCVPHGLVDSEPLSKWS